VEELAGQVNLLSIGVDPDVDLHPFLLSLNTLKYR